MIASVSSLAWFMSNQETSFVTIGQRVLASPLRLVFSPSSQNFKVILPGRDDNMTLISVHCSYLFAWPHKMQFYIYFKFLKIKIEYELK